MAAPFCRLGTQRADDFERGINKKLDCAKLIKHCIKTQSNLCTILKMRKSERMGNSITNRLSVEGACMDWRKL